MCIECSGIHRDLGVHISRIQSLTLDNVGTSQLVLARFMTNHSFNDIMEAQLSSNEKLEPSSSMYDNSIKIKKLALTYFVGKKDLIILEQNT